jgi:hypothetical protein
MHTVSLNIVLYNFSNYTEQSPSWEASSYSASQENSPPFVQPDSSLPCSQDPATESYPEPDASSPHLPTLFLYDPF